MKHEADGVGASETVYKNIKRKLQKLEIRGRINAVQAIAV